MNREILKVNTWARFESNYSSYYSNYSLIRTSIVATIVLLEINGGSEHRYSSRLSGSLALAISNKMGSRSVSSHKIICFRKKYSLCTIC